MKTKDTEVFRRQRAKPSMITVNCAHTILHRYNGTQYCSTETLLLMFPCFHTNITSRMWQSGGKGGIFQPSRCGIILLKAVNVIIQLVS